MKWQSKVIFYSSVKHLSILKVQIIMLFHVWYDNTNVTVVLCRILMPLFFRQKFTVGSVICTVGKRSLFCAHLFKSYHFKAPIP
jgi:hypothetical protein